MVGSLMKSKKISAVVVGADRVVANGDTANKIGTYQVKNLNTIATKLLYIQSKFLFLLLQIAVLAHYHKVPFYIAAPFTTIDFSIPNGYGIKIEERPHDEMTYINGVRIAAEGINVWNPSFDVTPADLITGIITEKGVYTPAELAKLKV